MGNAKSTIGYPANGESGDWLLGAKNIIGINIELGLMKYFSSPFYPPIQNTLNIIQPHYQPFITLLQRTTPEIEYVYVCMYIYIYIYVYICIYIV